MYITVLVSWIMQMTNLDCFLNSCDMICADEDSGFVDSWAGKARTGTCLGRVKWSCSSSTLIRAPGWWPRPTRRRWWNGPKTPGRCSYNLSLQHYNLDWRLPPLTTDDEPNKTDLTRSCLSPLSHTDLPYETKMQSPNTVSPFPCQHNFTKIFGQSFVN